MLEGRTTRRAALPDVKGGGDVDDLEKRIDSLEKKIADLEVQVQSRLSGVDFSDGKVSGVIAEWISSEFVRMQQLLDKYQSV